jgi:hypothetical protein
VPCRKGKSLDEIDSLIVNVPVNALDLSSGAVFRKEDDEVFRRERFRRVGRVAVARICGAAMMTRCSGAWTRAHRFVWPGTHGIGTGLDLELQAPCLAFPSAATYWGQSPWCRLGPHKNGNDIDDDEVPVADPTRGARRPGIRTDGLRAAAQRR